MTKSGGTVPTEYLLTSNFVKYNNLSAIIAESFKGSEATSVNLYIDLYGCFKPLFSDSFRTDISDYTAITSTIINMCGHYRSFFKQLGVHTKIFLVFSYNLPNLNKRFVSDYNSGFEKKFQNKIIYDMVEANCDLLEVLCPFLYDIFFVKTEYESSVLIDYLIMNGDKNPNVVISKDIYCSQMAYLHDDTIYIKPKKWNGEDVSGFIPTRQNIAFSDYFWSLYSSARNNVKLHRSTIWIHPTNFTLLSALTRFPERSYPTLYNIVTANKLIFNVAGADDVSVSTEQINDGTLSVSIIDNRHKALDVRYQRSFYLDDAEHKMLHLDNLDDPSAVRMICSQYFNNNPIDLNRL